MNKQLLTFLTLVVIGISACAQQQKMASATASPTASTNNKASVTPAENTAMNEEINAAPEFNYISMERTACFGKCPTYVLAMSSSGLVVYTSGMFTEYEGTYEKNIGAEKVEALFLKFSKYRVDTCKNRYEAYIQDLPGITYKLRYGNNEKTISNANFGPQFLKALADEMDKLAKVDRTWTKLANKPKQ